MTAVTALREQRIDTAATLEAMDRRLIVVTQEGLPRVSRPYHAIA